MTPMVHQRIPSSGWLRLLTFRPDDVPIISCNLHPHNFENAPKYYALSYHWGDGFATTSVECDGGELAISSSLLQALQRLRTIGQDSKISHFWVDQICINQSDPIERTDQVLQMGRIYRQSERTLIWLALPNHLSSHSVFALLRQVNTARQVPLAAALQISSKRITKEENQQLDLPDFTSKLWVDLGEFVENPWFQRTWIVQEAALSRTSPLILFEDLSIDFTEYLEIITWLDQRGFTVVTGCTPIPARPILISSIRRLLSADSGVLCLWKLEAILRMANHLRATDPRDRIYAFLGLTTHGEHGRNTDLALLPDYGRNIVELFASVTRYCIKESNRLQILGSGGVELPGDVEAATQMPAFPSWMPRWDCPRHSDMKLSGPHRLLPFVDGASQVDIVDIMPYEASKGARPLMRVSDDYRELILGGLHLDRISWSSDVVKREQFKGYVQSPILRLWEHALEQVSPPVDPTNETFQEFAASFYMALGSGLDPRDPSKFDTISSINHFWRYLTMCYEADCPDPDRLPSEIETYRSLGVDGDPRNVQTQLPGRKLFVTQGGRIGNGAATLQDDDDIFVLFGGTMPYVLRRRRHTHEMVGEVYIHGLMEGEAIQGWTEGVLKPQWVTLR